MGEIIRLNTDVINGHMKDVVHSMTSMDYEAILLRRGHIVLISRDLEWCTVLSGFDKEHRQFWRDLKDFYNGGQEYFKELMDELRYKWYT